jgi:hypothetical protein
LNFRKIREIARVLIFTYRTTTLAFGR